jgi:hypothetical protein
MVNGILIDREGFREGVEVCRRILQQAHHGIVSKDTEEVVDQIIGIWASGLESYLFDGITPSADPEEPKA